MKGTVSYFSKFKGYGFIVADDPNEPNYFAHYKQIQTNPAKRFLVEGQRVEFEPVEVGGKPQAHNIHKLADAPKSGGAH